METMLEHLMQSTLKMDKTQQTKNQTGAIHMASTHVVQKMFSIVDEIATILESMPRTFEGRQCRRWTNCKWNGNNKCEC